MPFPAATVTAILSLLPATLELANKTIDRIKHRKASSAAAGGDAISLQDRVQELEAAALRNAQAIKLLAEQSQRTVEVLRGEAAQQRRDLRRLCAVALLIAVFSLTLVCYLLVSRS